VFQNGLSRIPEVTEYKYSKTKRRAYGQPLRVTDTQCEENIAFRLLSIYSLGRLGSNLPNFRTLVSVVEQPMRFLY
jgi:hypothetical protein